MPADSAFKSLARDDTAAARLRTLVEVTRTFAGRATISRADVAGWMVEQVARPTFLGQAPVITVTGAASKG